MTEKLPVIIYLHQDSGLEFSWSSERIDQEDAAYIRMGKKTQTIVDKWAKDFYEMRDRAVAAEDEISRMRKFYSEYSPSLTKDYDANKTST